MSEAPGTKSRDAAQWYGIVYSVPATTQVFYLSVRVDNLVQRSSA
jgi:hypothetical protein